MQRIAFGAVLGAMLVGGDERGSANHMKPAEACSTPSS